ncbi:hypothetical protein BABINDRAFT_160762 [Babjeviella inositovora NRRL Y-12698]|uniref:Exocyst complex component SEC5 n=1 Tax=Babjeviella inositovora NRRL Y-12698 TaxID=984486 RepID=A0A1E3QS04_9ASCO|nr:uncharacterized protein BABINDRAFT_160762 [Babjeviella inositovora NRRL Y-12698]ODQ80483.1 hypothetical protein BABINDRAFT_160762 [Babjeviella inositovora NRRL Y-12698]
MLTGADDSDQQLLDFYGLKLLEPQSLADVISNDITSDTFPDTKTASPFTPEDADASYNLLISLMSDRNITPDQRENLDRDPLDGILLAKKLSQLRLPNSPALSPAAKGFNPILFLTTIHQADSLTQLNQSLKFLEQNIEGQAKQLQGLIDAKYLHFVSSKNAINQILDDFHFAEVPIVTKFNYETADARRTRPRFNMASLEENVKLLNYNAALSLKPVIDNRAKVSKMAMLMRFIEIHKFFFNLPSQLAKHIAAKSHDALIYDYRKCQKKKEEYMQKVDGEVRQNDQLSQAEGLQALTKVWLEVDAIIGRYKAKLHEELLDFLKNMEETRLGSAQSRFSTLINRFLDLGLDENPVRYLVDTQMVSITDSIAQNFEKLVAKFHASIEKLDLQNLKAVTIAYVAKNFAMGIPSRDVMSDSDELDAPAVIDSWNSLLAITSYLTNQLVPEMTRLLFNIKFLKENYKRGQNDNGWSQEETRLSLSESDMSTINGSIEKLVALICDKVKAVFYLSHDPKAEKGTVLAYGFMPKHTNSVSCLVYLTQVSAVIAEFLSKIASFGMTPRAVETLRDTNVAVNLRILEAICIAWIQDASVLGSLETFDLLYPQSAQDDATTSLPLIVLHYHDFVLTSLRNMIYWKGVGTYDIKIVTPPSKKIIVAISNQLEISLRKSLESIMTKMVQLESSDGHIGAAANMKHIYKVIMINNLERLRVVIYPTVVQQYDELFKESLSASYLKVYTLLEKFQVALFDNYIEKEKATVKEIVCTKIHLAFATSSESTAVSNYIYATLSHFTKITTSIENVSSREFHKILVALQEYFLRLVMEQTRDAKNRATAYSFRQIQIDLAFFTAVFYKGSSRLNPTCAEIVDKTLVSMKDRVEDSAALSRLLESVDEVVPRAIRESDIEFSCFKL